MEINSPLLVNRLNLGNFAAGGAVATAAASVDICASLGIAQTTATQVLTLPAPTVATDGRTIVVYNSGTAGFTMHSAVIAAGGVGLFFWESGAWRPVSSTPPADFWRSGGGTTLPDGATDLTDSITHTGQMSVGRIAPGTPAADLHVGGSTLFINGNSANRTASGVLDPAGGTVDVLTVTSIPQTTAGISLTLPAPTNASAGRMFRVMNTGTVNLGVQGFEIAPSRYADYMWTGAAWIFHDLSVTAANTVQMMVKGVVRCGDAIAAGARAVTNSYNVASATGLDNSGANARLQVNFTTALPDNDYMILGHFRSFAPGNWINDNDVYWSVVQKNNGNFIISSSEIAGSGQDLLFDFVVLRLNVPVAAPVQSRHVGVSGGNPSITFGNFVVRYNSASTNLEIATVLGNENISYYSMVAFGDAQFDDAVAVTIGTAFVTLGDPGVIGGQEMRRIFLGITTAGDTREYVIDFHSISPTRIALRMRDF
jgi:hypothetical protein